MDIILAVEELGLSGRIAMGKCSRSTLYRWAKSINGYLEKNGYEWSVKADYKKCCIKVFYLVRNNIWRRRNQLCY